MLDGSMSGHNMVGCKGSKLSTYMQPLVHNRAMCGTFWFVFICELWYMYAIALDGHVLVCAPSAKQLSCHGDWKQKLPMQSHRRICLSSPDQYKSTDIILIHIYHHHTVPHIVGGAILASITQFTRVPILAYKICFISSTSPVLCP